MFIKFCSYIHWLCLIDFVFIIWKLSWLRSRFFHKWYRDNMVYLYMVYDDIPYHRMHDSYMYLSGVYWRNWENPTIYNYCLTWLIHGWINFYPSLRISNGCFLNLLNNVYFEKKKKSLSQIKSIIHITFHVLQKSEGWSLHNQQCSSGR